MPDEPVRTEDQPPPGGETGTRAWPPRPATTLPPVENAASTGGRSGSREPDGVTVGPAGFALGDVLGVGGMGRVYRARDLAMRRDVAVKILKADYAPNGSAARRFVEEARITGQLQHPGIPPVYHVGEQADGRPFLAMKLVKGDTLDVVLKQHPVPDPGRLVAAFEGVCQAVGYAHARGVIHRDLKPQNVMVGAFGEVQVMDWGLAKLLTDEVRPAGDPELTADVATEIRSDRGTDEFTRAGAVMGTPAYMAPEQAIGAVDQLDRRTDVFGLGAVLCAILTGKPPFVGGDAESTRQMSARGRVEDAFARLDDCGADPELVGLCKCCLAVERGDRPADAGEVATAVAQLRAAADERVRWAEVEAERALVREAEGRKHRRTLVYSAIVVLLVALMGVGASIVHYTKAYFAVQDAKISKKRSDDMYEQYKSEYSILYQKSQFSQEIYDKLNKRGEEYQRDRYNIMLTIKMLIKHLEDYFNYPIDGLSLSQLEANRLRFVARMIAEMYSVSSDHNKDNSATLWRAKLGIGPSALPTEVAPLPRGVE